MWRISVGPADTLPPRMDRDPPLPSLSRRQEHLAARRRPGRTPVARSQARTIPGRCARVVLMIVAMACAAPAASVAGAALAASAQGGRPDPSFGGGRGWVTTRLPGLSAVAYGVTLLRSGGIVVAGQVTSTGGNGNGQILVVRYTANGSLDRSFGSRGVVKTSLPKANGPFIGLAVAQVKATGALLIAGGYGQGSMILMRLTPNGRLDRTFGPRRTGYVTAAVAGIAQSIAIQPNGGILLGGSNANANGRPMVVARFKPNGVLDSRFGRRGVAQAMFWNPVLAASAGATGLATTRDGGVVASGHIDYIGGDGHGSAGVFRLSSRGALVPSFGTRGHVEVAFKQADGAFDQWFPCGQVVDSRGRILVTGSGTVGSESALLSARLTAAGALDPSYGATGDGRSVTPGVGNGQETTCGAMIGATGNLTVGVGSRLVALLSDGSPNNSFAPGGQIRITSPPNIGLNAVALWGANRVVAVGSARGAVYVTRYLLATPS